MTSSREALNEKKLTWSVFLKWSFLLYLISLVCVFVKIYLQEGGKLIFTHGGQIFLVSIIPLVFMLLVSPVFFIGLAFNKFKIDKTKSVIIFTLTVYVVFFVSRILSIKPF